MEIHVQLAGIKLGPYSEKQVREYLGEGLLSSGDSACLEGTDEWMPVQAILARLPVKEALPTEPAVKNEEPPSTLTPPLQSEPAKEEKLEAKLDVRNESELETAPLPVPASVPVPKNEEAPLPARLVVKSLAKKNSHASKTMPGLVSMAPLATTAANLTPSFSEPIKVLTKKTEPEVKKIKTIQMAPAQGEPTSRLPLASSLQVAGKSTDPKPVASFPSRPNVEVPVSSPKPAIPAEVSPDPKTVVSIEIPKQETKTPSPSTLPAEATLKKPTGKIASISVGEPISLAQFLESQTAPSTVASPVRKPTGPMAKISAKEEKPAAAVPGVKAPVDKKKADAPKPPAKRGYLLWVLIGVGLIVLLGFCIWIFSRNGEAGRSTMKSGDQASAESTSSAS